MIYICVKWCFSLSSNIMADFWQMPQFQTFNTTGLEMLYSLGTVARLWIGMRIWVLFPARAASYPLDIRGYSLGGGGGEETRA
jgi:hypothetical protein